MLRVGSDFSGVGAFNQALMRLGVEYKEVFACDMDKYARQTFIHNYGEPDYFPMNVYDRAIPEEPLDIYMTSPPCQAFSLAGKRKGKDDMRGILFFNSLEFIRINKPRYFIFENVKGLLSDDNGKTFSEWVNLLGGKSVNGAPVIFPYDDSVPYHLYWQVLNAKHHGVPQNRERVFLVGIRDDKDNTFRFPPEEHLTKRLKDVLDDEVDEKYYLSSKMTEHITFHNKGQIEVAHLNKAGQKGSVVDENGCHISCLSATDYKLPKLILTTNKGEGIKVGTWRTDEDGRGFREIEDGNCPTIPARAREDGSGQPVVIQLNPSKESGGQQPYQQNRVYDPNGVSPALNEGQETWGGNAIIHNCITEAIGRQGSSKEFKDSCNKVYQSTAAIRRLTPRECFRLMDFPDSFYDKIILNNSINSQGILLYLVNKTDLICNASEKTVKGKLLQKECALCTIKDLENTEMRIMNLNTLTEEIKSVLLKIAIEMCFLNQCVQAITTQIENGEIHYFLSKDKIILNKEQSMSYWNQMGKEDLGERVSLNTDILLKITLDESLKELNKSTILIVTQIITTYLTYIYSIPKESICLVTINYKNLQQNLSNSELLHLKMGGILLSDSQLYKQAGNSIVVNVLYKIIKNLNL